MRNLFRKMLIWLLDKTVAGSKEPFSMYYTTGVQGTQCPISFMWNNAFIDNIKSYGISGEAEEEMVELFYVAMRPTYLPQEDEEEVLSEDHPNLSKDTNILKR